jgi:hypothetical protein
MPDKAIAYLDGSDARIFKRLLCKLGSEERVQNAMILTGLLSQTTETGMRINKRQANETKASFSEFVGVSFEDFNKMLETNQF